ncbi:unnamed protein product [Ectocarpus sp. 12 AP-2014]
MAMEGSRAATTDRRGEYAGSTLGASTGAEAYVAATREATFRPVKQHDGAGSYARPRPDRHHKRRTPNKNYKTKRCLHP